MAEDEMVRQHHQLKGHEFVQTLGDTAGQRSLACCSPWGHKKLDKTVKPQQHPINVQLSGQQKAMQTQWATSVPLQGHRNVGIWFGHAVILHFTKYWKIPESDLKLHSFSLLITKLPSWLALPELSQRRSERRRWREEMAARCAATVSFPVNYNKFFVSQFSQKCSEKNDIFSITLSPERTEIYNCNIAFSLLFRLS